MCSRWYNLGCSIPQNPRPECDQSSTILSQMLFLIFINKISKQEIDKFHSACYLLPTFELMLHYSAESGELWQEESKFILRRAKPPQNFFRVDLDPSMSQHR